MLEVLGFLSCECLECNNINWCTRCTRYSRCTRCSIAKHSLFLKISLRVLYTEYMNYRVLREKGRPMLSYSLIHHMYWTPFIYGDGTKYWNKEPLRRLELFYETTLLCWFFAWPPWRTNNITSRYKIKSSNISYHYSSHILMRWHPKTTVPELLVHISQYLPSK